VKFIPSHVPFVVKSNSENCIKIVDEVTDKNKLARKSTTGELIQTVRRQWRLELSPCSYWLQVVTASADESKMGGEWAWLFLSTLGHGEKCTALVRELSRVFVAVARPTLSVEQLLGYSFKTPKVACDCLKVGRHEVETHFQAVARHFGSCERIA